MNALPDLLGLDDRLFGDLLALLQVLHARPLLDRLVASHQLLAVMCMWGAPPAPEDVPRCASTRYSPARRGTHPAVPPHIARDQHP